LNGQNIRHSEQVWSGFSPNHKKQKRGSLKTLSKERLFVQKYVLIKKHERVSIAFFCLKTAKKITEKAALFIVTKPKPT